MEVKGMAHVILTASNFERSREFYRKLLPFLGLQPMIDSDEIFYCVGGRTALGIRKPAAEHAGAVFEQSRVGLHHLCFRARERADVDELHGFLCSLDAKIIRVPREDQWAPGYYFGAVRGRRWDQAGAQLRSGQGIAGVSFPRRAVDRHPLGLKPWYFVAANLSHPRGERR
jgi:catechol 2,3-dioxygenase-like lactoylglutathione lyase family enzyme